MKSVYVHRAEKIIKATEKRLETHDFKQDDVAEIKDNIGKLRHIAKKIDKNIDIITNPGHDRWARLHALNAQKSIRLDVQYYDAIVKNIGDLTDPTMNESIAVKLKTKSKADSSSFSFKTIYRGLFGNNKINPKEDVSTDDESNSSGKSDGGRTP